MVERVGTRLDLEALQGFKQAVGTIPDIRPPTESPLNRIKETPFDRKKRIEQEDRAHSVMHEIANGGIQDPAVESRIIDGIRLQITLPEQLGLSSEEYRVQIADSNAELGWLFGGLKLTVLDRYVEDQLAQLQENPPQS